MRELKGKWETKKTKEARDSRDHGKTVWRVIRELNGKVRTYDEAFIYVEGIKHNIDDAWDKVVSGWTEQFQMRRNTALSAWEGGWGPGLREKYLDEIHSR